MKLLQGSNSSDLTKKVSSLVSREAELRDNIAYMKQFLEDAFKHSTQFSQSVEDIKGSIQLNMDKLNTDRSTIKENLQVIDEIESEVKTTKSNIAELKTVSQSRAQKDLLPPDQLQKIWGEVDIMYNELVKNIDTRRSMLQSQLRVQKDKEDEVRSEKEAKAASEAKIKAEAKAKEEEQARIKAEKEEKDRQAKEKLEQDNLAKVNAVKEKEEKYQSELAELNTTINSIMSSLKEQKVPESSSESMVVQKSYIEKALADQQTIKSQIDDVMTKSKPVITKGETMLKEGILCLTFK